MPFSLAADIVGTDLTGNGQHVSVGQIGAQKNPFFRDHRQGIHGAGKSGNLQKKAKKTSSVVFMGEPGQGNEAAPQCDLIYRMFHQYHLKITMYGTSYAVAVEREQKKAGTSAGLETDY